MDMITQLRFEQSGLALLTPARVTRIAPLRGAGLNGAFMMEAAAGGAVAIGVRARRHRPEHLGKRSWPVAGRLSMAWSRQLQAQARRGPGPWRGGDYGASWMTASRVGAGMATLEAPKAVCSIYAIR